MDARLMTVVFVQFEVGAVVENVRVKSFAAPEASVPRSHESVLPARVQVAPEAETYVRPVGMVSVTMILLTEAGPEFVAVRL